MKKLFRYACGFLAILMILAVPAHAAGSANSRASSFFVSTSVYLYKLTDTTFEAWFEAAGVGIMDEIGASEIRIQRSLNQENWTTVKTYTKDAYSNLIDTNTGMHTDCITYTGTRGYYYRAYITLYAKNSNGTGVLYRYTSAIKL